MGTDGSDQASYAIVEAARQAEVLGVPLHIVTVYQPLFGVAMGGTIPREERERLNAILEAATAAVTENFSVPVTAELIDADCAAEMMTSAQASMIVVGAVGVGSPMRLVLGSQTSRVAARTAAPVLVVRDEAEVDLTGPVTCGIAPERDETDLVIAAANYADRHGVDLEVVRAHQHRAANVANMVEGPDKEAVVAAATESAAKSRAIVDGLTPRVTATVRFRHETRHAIDALVDASATSSLIVLGRNTNGSTRLGSVTLTVLHYAPRVLVLPPWTKEERTWFSR